MIDLQALAESVASHPYYRGYFRRRHIYVSIAEGEINAYATYRSEVLAFRSLHIVLYADLIRSCTPAQLRAVLAHELEHHRRGDYNRNLSVDLLAASVAALLLLCALQLTLLLGYALLLYIVSLPFLYSLINAYLSRRAEYACDRAAAEVAGLEAILSTLDIIAGAEGGTDRKGLFATHPSTEERKNNILNNM